MQQQNFEFYAESNVESFISPIPASAVAVGKTGQPP